MTTAKGSKGRAAAPKRSDVLATPPASARTKAAVVPLSYSIGTWGGVRNYSCNRCPFATTDRGDMVLHVVSRHGAEVREGEDSTDTHS